MAFEELCPDGSLPLTRPPSCSAAPGDCPLGFACVNGACCFQSATLPAFTGGRGPPADRSAALKTSNSRVTPGNFRVKETRSFPPPFSHAPHSADATGGRCPGEGVSEGLCRDDDDCSSPAFCIDYTCCSFAYSPSRLSPLLRTSPLPRGRTLPFAPPSRQPEVVLRKAVLGRESAGVRALQGHLGLPIRLFL